jgi:TonB family protein
MSRRLPALALALAAPAAAAWVPCNSPEITAPVAVRREAPAYPPAVRETGIEGSVEVALTVLADGGVGWARVVRAEPRGYFEQAAIAGVRAWRFEPARAGGRAIECRMLTRVVFTLVDTVDAATSGAGDRPAPAYPARLLAERVEGYVEVEFELGADGAVANARAITAMPRGEFEGAALAAIRRWQFAPPDQPGERRTRRFEFRLPDSTLDVVPPTLLASAPFPIAACQGRIRGRVALEVATDATGRVQQARILSAEPQGLFDATARTIARGSRLSPAWRDGQAVAATALLTLYFDPEKATCPGGLGPERDPGPAPRPQPRVSRVDEWPAPRGGW